MPLDLASLYLRWLCLGSRTFACENDDWKHSTEEEAEKQNFGHHALSKELRLGAGEESAGYHPSEVLHPSLKRQALRIEAL